LPLPPLTDHRIVDLAQPWHPGMPHWPTHPPFTHALSKLHGEVVLEGGASSAADAISLGTHTGTHMDSLGHFSCNGFMHGGIPAESNQDYAGGLSAHSIDLVPPILRRAVLVDVARLAGVDALPPDFAIGAEFLQNADIQPGDIVLFRTGWARFWHSPARFINNLHIPGVTLEAARVLSSRNVYAAGADTAAFERTPSNMEVHVHLLVRSGIYIIECLNLEELAAASPDEFLFAAAPLKIRGATGAPVRPFALIPPGSHS
jgi:kynurenine formamidase